MKKIIIILLSIAYTHSIHGQQYTVEQVVNTFFEGMAEHDTLKIKTTVHASCMLRSISNNKSGQTVISNDDMEKFYRSIGGLPKDMVIDERISKIETNQDDLMAYAWTPYRLFINEKLSHSGTNLFTLAKIEGTWKIVAIIDTRFR